MSQTFYETIQKTSPLGISFAWQTAPGGYHPIHWHDEIELLYLLNGSAEIIIEGKQHSLPTKHLIAIESKQVHSTHVYSPNYMFLCIHAEKSRLKDYIEDIDHRYFRCFPESVLDNNFPEYLAVCKMLERLTRLYMADNHTFLLEAEGIILQILAKLYQSFSCAGQIELYQFNQSSAERLQKVISYTEAHFKEPISLQDISDFLGLRKEYFCRFFKKNIGISFLNYLSEVRCAHIYDDLIHTDLPVSDIIEKNGFTNQKLFNRTFKEIYGNTPSSVRKMSSDCATAGKLNTIHSNLNIILNKQ